MMTGLVWRRCVEGMVWSNGTQTCDGTATDFQWKQGADLLPGQSQGGWRIPNVKELYSIVDQKRVTPSGRSSGISQYAGGSLPFIDDVGSSGGVYLQVVTFGIGTIHQEEVERFGH
jgi:hypothetical protein